VISFLATGRSLIVGLVRSLVLSIRKEPYVEAFVCASAILREGKRR